MDDDKLLDMEQLKNVDLDEQVEMKDPADEGKELDVEKNEEFTVKGGVTTNCGEYSALHLTLSLSS
jgi:hypothetical protein